MEDKTIGFESLQPHLPWNGAHDPGQYTLFETEPNQGQHVQAEIDKLVEKKIFFDEERMMWSRAVATRDQVVDAAIIEELARSEYSGVNKVLPRAFKEKWMLIINDIDTISEERAEADFRHVLNDEEDGSELRRDVLTYIAKQTVDTTRFTENPHYSALTQDAKKHAQLKSLYSFMVMPRIVGKLVMSDINDIISAPSHAIALMERLVKLAEASDDVSQNPNRGILESMAAHRDNTPNSQNALLAGLRAQAVDREAFLQHLLTDGGEGHHNQKNQLIEAFRQTTRLWFGNDPDLILHAAQYGAANADRWPKALEQEFQQTVAPEKHTLWLRYNRAIDPYRSPARAPEGMKITQKYFRKKLKNPARKTDLPEPLDWEAVGGMQRTPNPFLP